MSQESHIVVSLSRWNQRTQNDVKSDLKSLEGFGQPYHQSNPAKAASVQRLYRKGHVPKEVPDTVIQAMLMENP